MGVESLLLDTDAEWPNDAEQFDVAAYAASATFNAVALPPNMPDYLKRAIEAQAERERAQPGPMTMAGTADTTETQEDRDKKAADRAADQLNIIAQQQQQEREEWAQTEHSFGTTSMTGAEWSKLADDLKSDGVLRDWLLARIMQDGKTDAEAKAIADKVARVAEIMAKPESQRTTEEKEDLAHARRDPTINKYAEQAAEHQKEMTGAAVERDITAAHGTTSTSIDARADQLEAFASAPDLMRHHQSAIVATTPLDIPEAPTPTNTPPPPQLTASGFDI